MIAVCPNPYRDINLELTNRAVSLLNNAGFDTVICKIFDESGESLKDYADDISLAVVVGGDGTILKAADDLEGSDVPIIGVNLGTKGFMASVEPEEIEKVVDAAKGEFIPSVRMMLDVELKREGSMIYTGNCLNDAVVHGYGDTISISAFIGDSPIIKFSGDGIVLSTPTGSTGYSMSAGGPIAEPEARAIIISPICAHSLRARNYVVGPDRVVTVKTEKLFDRRAYLSVDGVQVADILSGDIVTVKESSHRITFASIGTKSFFETAFEKLM